MESLQLVHPNVSKPMTVLITWDAFMGNVGIHAIPNAHGTNIPSAQ